VKIRGKGANNLSLKRQRYKTRAKRSFFGSKKVKECFKWWG